MSKFVTGRGARGLRYGVAMSVLAIAVSAAGAAAAQTAEADEPAVEEVVVTGFRGSLREAIDVKRSEVGAVDAIVAEDIADFPDLNLSESIQRIPGVAITRDAGEGRQISVRGLGPQFTRVRINGMEALSTVGGTDAAGGTNRDRSFDFNVFAADLFNSITVRKTASAEVEEGSLGATVDLQTARPFDYKDFTFAASGQLGYNDLSESTDPRAAFLISNRWADGRFGALLSVAYGERIQKEEGASTVRWRDGGTTNCDTAATSSQAGNCFGSVMGQTRATQGADWDAVNAAFRPRIPRYDIYEHEQKRLGVTAALQWRPVDSTRIDFEALYAKFDATRSEIFLESPVFSTSGGSGINNVDVTAYEIQNNSLVYGVFNDVDIRSEMRFDELSTEFTQYTLNGTHDFSDKLRVHGMAGWSESDHTNPIQTTLLFDANDIDGYSYDFRGNNRLPVITYGTTDVTDPATWTLSQIRLRPQTANNTYKTLQADAEYDWSDSLSFKAGVALKEYGFETTEKRRSNGTTSNLEANIPGFAASTALSAYSRLISLSGQGLDIPAGNTSTWLIPDIEKAAALWGLYDTSIFPMGIEPALGNNREVEEENTSAFVQADFEADVLGVPMRGNVGVRYVETSQASTGYTFSAGVPVKTTVEREYTDTLPSLNLVFEPVEDFLVRVGAGQVMARPGLGNLNPGASVSVSGSNFTVTAGNPDLDPFRATAYDLSLEWYFAPESLLSVAFFYKDIDSFVQTIRESRPFTGNPLGLPDSVATAACGAAPGCSASANWQFNIPQNTPGGPVKGIEIGYQQPFTFLPGFLADTGFTGNITFVESEITYLNATGGVTAVAPLTGLSERSANATFYYEGDKLAARVSAAYRSDYLTTIPGRDGNTSESTAGTLNVDVSASYAVNDQWTVTFEGLNLTDEVNDQFLSPDDRLSFYHHFGRQYFVGFRFKY